MLSHSSLFSRVDNVMGLDLVRNLVMDYVGMNNWEIEHSFLVCANCGGCHVCKHGHQENGWWRKP